MAELHNDIRDNGLSSLVSLAETMHILSADPGLTWANIASYTLGNKSAPSIAAPSDRSGGGREVVVAAISDGGVTATGTWTHWAITDDSATQILASGAIDTPVGVTSGQTFATDAFAIGIP